jgi:hypothetical protein
MCGVFFFSFAPFGLRHHICVRAALHDIRNRVAESMANVFNASAATSVLAGIVQ